MEKFLAVSADGFARMYGQGERGMGHALYIPAGFQGDPIASGGKITRACSGWLASEKATEKFLGEKQCPKCVEWLASPEGVAAIEAARGERHAWEFGTDDLAELFRVEDVTVSGTDNGEDVRELTPADVKAAVSKSTRGAAVARERKRLADQREARENSAPALPGAEIIASTGKTLAQMNAETAAFYANGGSPSVEILTLPNPAVNLANGTVSGGALPVLPCEFTGGVEIINPEKTHGKCPGCTTYIPLLPESGVREAAPKVSKIVCSGFGSRPAPGTQVLRDDHTVKVADDHNGKTSAPCPDCARMIAVSREGNMRKHNGMTTPDVREESPDRIGTHNVGGVPTPQLPAGKRLTSRSVDIVEHGSVPGDTSTADKRRTDESRCKRGNKVLKDAAGGTVECPECTRPVELLKVTRPNGDVSWKVPHHVLPGESVKHVGRGEVRDVTPRGEGRDVGKGAGARVALSRGHGSVDGAATTGSQNMAPVQPRGWLGTAGTGQLPATVRPGIDPEVTGDICPLPECGGQRKDVAHKNADGSPKSKGWRRRHSSKLGAYLAARTELREAERAAKIESGEILPTPVKREARRAASVGSFSEGNVNGTVTHAPRPEFAPKGARKPAPNRKGGGKHTVRSGKAE